MTKESATDHCKNLEINSCTLKEFSGIFIISTTLPLGDYCSIVHLILIYSLFTRWKLHCTGNPIYVFPEKKLRGLVPNSYIHISGSEL